MLKNQKGITLIALIITIIVMLILVGVTVNVALNGGLFTKAEQATKQMEASMVKEQFEIAKAVAIANNGGKKLEDYSIITIDKLDLDGSTKDKYTNKIFMSPKGNVCYNSDKLTEKEKEYFEAVGIEPGEEVKTGYSFTLNELGVYTEEDDSRIGFDPANAWNVIGKDLTQDTDYALQDGGQIAFELKSDNDLFQGLIALEFQTESLKNNTKFLIMADIHDGVFEFAVLNADESEVISSTPSENQMRASEFIQEYGDVEFTFVKLSELGITTE